MKKSTLAIILGLAAAALLGVFMIAGVAGFMVYRHFRAVPLPITDASLLEPTPFADATVGYQIRPPLGWRANPDSLTRKIRLWLCATPDVIDGRPSTANINVGTDVYSGGDYAAAAIRVHQRDHPDFHLISNRRYTINGRSAQIIDYTYTTRSGIPVHMQQTMIPSGGTVYLITSLTHVQTWELHRRELESSTASFEITR